MNSAKRQLQILGFLFFLLITAPAGTAFAYILESPDPEPFRRGGEITGRAHRYDRDTFLHRFTYRYHPEAAKIWHAQRRGFRATVGSVKSHEAYVRMQAYKTVEFDIPAYFTYRFKRDEDFDGRYDSNLIGLGIKFPENWSLAAFSDVEGNKENLDAHFELAKKYPGGNCLRLGFTAVDLTYNEKQTEEKYERKPFTYFAEGNWQEKDNFGLHGFVNYNSPLRLNSPVQEFNFWYEQITGGLALTKQLSGTTKVFTSFKAERGTRDRWSTAAVKTDERHLSRRYAECTLQLTRTLAEDLDVWSGARYLALLERDRRPLEPDLERNERRRERMAYGGVSWQFHEKALFWPGVYLNFADNRIDYPLSGRPDDADKGCFSKLALPLEVTLSDSASFTFNVTMRLHRLAFGGMNFQAGFRF